MSNKFSASWKNGEIASVSHRFFPNKIKKLLEQFSVYVLCCFKKYASTSVIGKVITKFESGHVK